MSASPAVKSKNRRRFFRPRFSLAVLLVLITVVAIPLAYVAQRRSWNLRRAQARRQLEGIGLRLVIAYSTPKPSGLRGFWVDFLFEDFDCIYSVHDSMDDEPRDNVAGNRNQAPSDLAGLRYFPEILHLRLCNRADVTDESLEVVRFLPRLEGLQLTNLPKVTGRFLTSLSNPKRMLNLRLAKLPSLNSPALRMITQMDQLGVLTIFDCPLLTDNSFRDVDLPEGLSELCVGGCDLGDVTLGRWLGSCKLEYLHLQARVSRDLAPRLAKQTDLESLQISNAPFLDEDFAFLADCDDLYALHLSGMPVEGKFLTWIREGHVLERLELPSTLLRDDYLQELARFTKLDDLDLSWTPINGEGFHPAPTWKNLLRLYLAGTRFSDLGKQRLSTLDLSGITAGLHLPCNWTHDDLKRYRSDHFPEGSLSTRQAKVQLAETGKSVSYSTKELSLREEPLDNFPRELMAPVLRLHELARAETDEDAAAGKER